MIGPIDDDREIVDWRKREIDGETVYEIEYDEPVPDIEIRSPPRFGSSSGGTVPTADQSVRLPDGERIPASEALLEADGTTLRIRRRDSSVLARLRQFLPWTW